MAGGSEVAVDRTTRSEPNRRANDAGPVALKVAAFDSLAAPVNVEI
jgi:hypothetical protein